MQDLIDLEIRTCPKCGGVAVSSGPTVVAQTNGSPVIDEPEDLLVPHVGRDWSCVSCDYSESVLT